MERDATGLFHLANDGECSWFEFAQATFDIAGVAVNHRAERDHSRRAASQAPAILGPGKRAPCRDRRAAIAAVAEALEHYLQR